jgi:CheY-like chemotaxis protein
MPDKLHQLFQLTTQIVFFDEDNYQKNILEEVTAIFESDASLYLNVADVHHVFFSHFKSFNPAIIENDLISYLQNESFDWAKESGPYIGSFGSFSVLGIPFLQQTWGVFIFSRHPLPNDVQALETFSKSVAVWFNSPFLFLTSDPPVKFDMVSERKYAALQTLYSIAEWEWDLNTNDCFISESFIAFFDHINYKEAYTISDLYNLIGESNTERFKECMEKVVTYKYQVFEEFKCPLLDQTTYQHIQMLFDPVYEGDNLVRIIGFCRDNGRTYVSDEHQLKWFDSEWLHDLPLLPLEWIVHSNFECEISTSPFHKHQMKDDAEKLIKELTRHLTHIFSMSHIEDNLNITIKFPFSRYYYQLIAAKSEIDHLLWRGFMILLSEKDVVGRGVEQSANAHPKAHISQLLQCLNQTTSIEVHHPLLDYLTRLHRYSKEACSFQDFWTQLEELVHGVHANVVIQKKINTTLDVPHAQWVLSLVSFIISYFKLDEFPLKIAGIENPLIDSKNENITSSKHVIEISFLSNHIDPAPRLVSLLFQLSLMETGIDIGFYYNDLDWKCGLLVALSGAEKSVIVHSNHNNKSLKKPQSKTILIVDDDQYNTQTLEVLFHSDGFRTISANQGEHALRLIDNIDLIDAIILDVKMPVLDGFGVLEKLKNMPHVSHIPVVVLSANITAEISQKLNQYNVSAIIEKPFDMDDLMGHINKIVFAETVVTNI